jgi:hypothetical protein
VELVGTALGDDVDHAAGRTAELGAVAAGLDLLLGNALERHLAEVEVLERVGDVEAVDEVLVLVDRAAAEGSEVAERGVALTVPGASSATEVMSRGTGILAICSEVRIVVDSTDATSIALIDGPPTTVTLPRSRTSRRRCRRC